MKRVIRFLSRTSWIQHPVFWVLSFYMIGSYFSVSNTVKFIDFYYALFFHVSIVVLVYMNLRLLIPFLFQKEYYVWYVIAGGANMLLAVLVHHFTFEIFLPLLPTDYYIVSFTDINVLLGVFFIYWLLSSLIKHRRR